MKYDKLIKDLRICANPLYFQNCDSCEKCSHSNERSDCYNGLKRSAADAIEELLGVIQRQKEMINVSAYLPLYIKPKWISVSDRLPECEQEVLICTEKKLVGGGAYIDSIVTPAIYEDGTMRENESKWRWEDVDWAGWDEEEDCGIIPEGWWENRHFNPDDVYNNPVDRKVVAWMPLPKPPKDGGT